MTATTENFANVSASSNFQTVGSEFAGLQLKDVLKTLPRECFQKDRRKAWFMVFGNVAAVVLGYIGLAISPWFLLPIVWIFTGTALTGFFVIAHDCGHRSFAKRRWVNDWVGHIFMLPLIYPFHCWRILHDYHHLHTNELHVDNAWQPWTPEAFTASPAIIQVVYRAMRGRLWWLASIVHWGKLHFDLNQFAPKDRSKAKISIAAVAVFAAVFFPTLILTTGLWGFVKFWLMPWLVYHFWMSTFTLVHHTAPDIQFHPTQDWNAVEAQLAGTVHCSYPRWVEFLCHDINVHVPHHLSVAIPSYNLRMAHESIRQNWGNYIHESQFSWEMMQQIVDHCHLYDPNVAYQSFESLESHNR